MNKRAAWLCAALLLLCAGCAPQGEPSSSPPLAPESRPTEASLGGGEPLPPQEPYPVFLAGPGGEPYEACFGFAQNGWTLRSAEYPEGPEMGIVAAFSGEATLKGRIDISDGRGEGDLMGRSVTFTVAEESVTRLPYYEHDTRAVWFEIVNGDAVRALAGVESGAFADCEITISGYDYVCRPMAVWNSAEVKAIHRIAGPVLSGEEQP